MARGDNFTPPEVIAAAEQQAEEREESDNRAGREIKGLEPKPERFSRLQEGRDYGIVKLNDAIDSERPLEDFFVFVNPSKGDVTLTVQPPHWRAITTPEVKSSLRIPAEGNRSETTQHFYVVNTKGVGYLKPSVRNDSIDNYNTWIHEGDRLDLTQGGFKVLGLSPEDTSVFDKSNFLATHGLRCELHWAIGELKRVPYNGKLTALSTLAKKEVVSDEPFYEEIRLLKTNDRIEEAAEADDRREELFKQAFETFNKEGQDTDPNFVPIEFSNPEHQRIYFKEFTRRLGANIATLLNLGWRHGHLHSSNITMAAEVVDVDTARHYSQETEEKFNIMYGGVRRSHLKDMRDSVYGIRKLLKAGKAQGLHTAKREQLTEVFMEGFDETFDRQTVAQQGIDPVKTRDWMQSIITTVIARRENLPSLLHNEVEDWPISIK